MNPWDDFAAAIDAGEDVNVYPAMAKVIETPAIVIVPNEPWFESSGFSYDTERYLAICLATSAAPEDALDKLHRMVHAIRSIDLEGWEIGQASGVRDASLPDDSTRYLGSWVEVSYRNCEHTVEEGS